MEIKSIREEVKRQLENYGYCSECHMFGTPTPNNEVQCGNCGKFTLFMLKDFMDTRRKAISIYNASVKELTDATFTKVQAEAILNVVLNLLMEKSI